MRSSTGRWVSGGDFFNRERELRILETLGRDHHRPLESRRSEDESLGDAQ